MNNTCKSCGGKCCDGSIFYTVGLILGEATKFRKMGAKVIRVSPHSPNLSMDVRGGCQFLKDGQCSIYPQRPYHCGKWVCRKLESE